jgi:hypothetical protein
MSQKMSKSQTCWREAEMGQVDERRQNFLVGFTQKVGIAIRDRLNIRSMLKQVWTARVFEYS